MSHRRESFCFILSLPLLFSKSPHHARESVGRRRQKIALAGQSRKSGEWRRWECSIRPSNQTALRTPQMRSRKVATARRCRRGPACVYPAIRDGWPTGARKQSGLAGNG